MWTCDGLNWSVTRKSRNLLSYTTFFYNCFYYWNPYFIIVYLLLYVLLFLSMTAHLVCLKSVKIIMLLLLIQHGEFLIMNGTHNRARRWRDLGEWRRTHDVVSLNRLSVGCGTTPRWQSGECPGFWIYIRVIYTMLPPHGYWLILP